MDYFSSFVNLFILRHWSLSSESFCHPKTEIWASFFVYFVIVDLVFLLCHLLLLLCPCSFFVVEHLVLGLRVVGMRGFRKAQSILRNKKGGLYGITKAGDSAK
jgi:hypothetical protein